MPAKLYPPRINGTLPAFWINYDSSNLIQLGADISIPFEMNQAVSSTQVKGMMLRLRTASSGSYLFSPIFSTEIDKDYKKVKFHLSNNEVSKLNEGQFYKVQIAYCSSTNVDALNVEDNEMVGYFSTVGVIKCTSKPSIYINNLSQENINLFANQFIGVYDISDCRDQTEKVYSYEFNVYDQDDNLYYTTKEQLHKSYYDTSMDLSFDTVLLNDFINDSINYNIEYRVTTINGLELSTPRYKLTSSGLIPPNDPIEIIPKVDDENGYTVINFKGSINEDKSFYYLLKEEAFKDIEMDNIPIFSDDPVLVDQTKELYQYFYNKDMANKTPVDRIKQGVEATSKKIEFIETKTLYRQWKKNIYNQAYYYYTVRDREDLNLVLVAKKYYFSEKFLQRCFNEDILTNEYKETLAELNEWPEEIQQGWDFLDNAVYYEKIADCHDLVQMLSYTELKQSIYSLNDFGDNLLAKSEYESLYYGAYILSRASSDDNYSTWYNISRFRLDDQTPSSFSIKDITIEHGKKYKYALTQYNLSGLQTSKTISEPYFAGFEDAYLYDGEKSLRIRYNPEVSSFKITVLEQKSDTLGGRFPFITRNGDSFYREFPIAGLLAEELDIDNSFCYKEKPDPHRHSTGALQNKYDKNGNLIEKTDMPQDGLRDWRMFSDENIALEREFKMNVLEWLNNGKPKLFKSPYEGNFIVRLLNNSLTPIKELGRMLHNFQSQAYEIAECTYENLVAYGFIKVGFPTDYVGLFRTYNFTDPENFNANGDIEITFDDSLVSFTIQDMMPGEIVYLKFNDIEKVEEIMIGITGSYTYTGDKTVKQVFIPQHQYDKIYRKIIGTINCYYYGARITAFDAIMNMTLKTIPSQQFIGVDPRFYTLRSNTISTTANNAYLSVDNFNVLSDYNIRDYITKLGTLDKNNDYKSFTFSKDPEDRKMYNRLINSFDPTDLIERINTSINSGSINKLELIKLEHGKFRLRELIPVYEVNANYNSESYSGRVRDDRYTHKRDFIHGLTEDLNRPEQWPDGSYIQGELSNNYLIGEDISTYNGSNLETIYVSTSPFGYPFPIEELAETELIDPFCIFEVFRRYDGQWVPVTKSVDVRKGENVYTNYYDPYYKTWIPYYDPIVKINYKWKKMVYAPYGFDLDLEEELDESQKAYALFCSIRRKNLNEIARGLVKKENTSVEDYTIERFNGQYYFLKDEWTVPGKAKYIEINFEGNDYYEPNKYYYKDNDQYIIDDAIQPVEGRQYYMLTSDLSYWYTDEINLSIYDCFEPVGNTYLLTEDETIQPYKIYYYKDYDNNIDMAAIREKDYTALDDVNSICIGSAVMAELTFQLKILDFRTETVEHVAQAKEEYLKAKEFFANLLKSYSILETADQLQIRNNALKELYYRLLYGTINYGYLSETDRIYLQNLLKSTTEVDKLNLLSLYEVTSIDDRIGEEIISLATEVIFDSKTNYQDSFAYENLKLFIFTDDINQVYYVIDTGRSDWYKEDSNDLTWYYQIQNNTDEGIYFAIDKSNYFINEDEEIENAPFLTQVNDTKTIQILPIESIVNQGYTVYKLEEQDIDLVTSNLQLLNDTEVKTILQQAKVLEVRKIIYEDGHAKYIDTGKQIDEEITKTFFENEEINILANNLTDEEIKGTEYKQQIVNSTLNSFRQELATSLEEFESIQNDYRDNYNAVMKAEAEYNDAVYFRWALDEAIRLLKLIEDEPEAEIDIQDLLDYFQNNQSEIHRESHGMKNDFDYIFEYYSAAMTNKNNLKNLLSARLDDIIYRREMIHDNFNDPELDQQLQNQIYQDFGMAIFYLYLFYYLITLIAPHQQNMIRVKDTDQYSEYQYTQVRNYIRQMYNTYTNFCDKLIEARYSYGIQDIAHDDATKGLLFVINLFKQQFILADNTLQSTLETYSDFSMNILLEKIADTSKIFDDIFFLYDYDLQSNTTIASINEYSYTFNNIKDILDIYIPRQVSFVESSPVLFKQAINSAYFKEAEIIAEEELNPEDDNYLSDVLIFIIQRATRTAAYANTFNNLVVDNLYYYRSLLESKQRPSSQDTPSSVNIIDIWNNTFIFNPLNDQALDKEIANKYSDFTYMLNETYFQNLSDTATKAEILRVCDILLGYLIEILTQVLEKKYTWSMLANEQIQRGDTPLTYHYDNIVKLSNEESLLFNLKNSILDFNNFIQNLMNEYGSILFVNDTDNYGTILNNMLLKSVTNEKFMSRSEFNIPENLFTEEEGLYQLSDDGGKQLKAIQQALFDATFKVQSMNNELQQLKTYYETYTSTITTVIKEKPTSEESDEVESDTSENPINEIIENMIILEQIEEENATKYIGITDANGKQAYNDYNKLYNELIPIYNISRFIATWNYNNSKPLTRISNEDILAGWIKDPNIIDTYQIYTWQIQDDNKKIEVENRILNYSTNLKNIVDRILHNLRYEYFIDEQHQWNVSADELVENIDLLSTYYEVQQDIFDHKTDFQTWVNNLRLQDYENDLEKYNKAISDAKVALDEYVNEQLESIKNIHIFDDTLASITYLYNITTQLINENFGPLYITPKVQEYLINIPKNITEVIDNTLEEDGTFYLKFLKNYEKIYIDTKRQLIEQAEQLLLLYEKQAKNYREKYEDYKKIYDENKKIYNDFKTLYPEIYNYYESQKENGSDSLTTLEQAIEDQRTKVRDAWKKFLNLLDMEYTKEKKQGLYV